MNYYIADTHFGHANIIHLCNRPFQNVDEMDDALIKNWNSRVTKKDTVYILGDFAFKSKSPLEYFNQLNGRKS
jgi:calcineurin-like phosphoesterase family protein